MSENTSAQKSPRLEELVRQRFTPEGKPERVGKVLAALYQAGWGTAELCDPLNHARSHPYTGMFCHGVKRKAGI